MFSVLGLFESCFAETAIEAKKETKASVEVHKFNADDFDEKDPFRKEMLRVSRGCPVYYFSFHNWPSNQEIVVSKKNLIDNLFENLEKSTYIPQGKFIIREDGSIDDNGKVGLPYFYFSSYGFAPGERVHILFRTSDEKFKEELTWIPIPIIAQNKEGTITLEAELVIAVPTTLYTISIKGLKQGKHFKFQSTSGDETLNHMLTYPEGSAITFSPGVIGLKGGTSTVSITPSKEVLTISLPWGLEIAEYISGKKIYKP